MPPYSLKDIFLPHPCTIHSFFWTALGALARSTSGTRMENRTVWHERLLERDRELRKAK
jgi:hypothetical protein